MQAYSPNWSSLTVRGRDAASFLHNLCTNDIKAMAVGDCREAFFTDVKAHVLAFALVCRSVDGFAVVVTSPHAAELATHLEKYHIRERISVSVDEPGCLSLYWDGSPYGERAQDCLFPVASLSATLCVNDTCMDTMERLVDAAYHTRRIERAFPLDRVDVDASRLPQEVNRDTSAISFTKGCYLGQETVARIDALGHVNRKLVSVRFDGPEPPSVGAELTAGGKPVGVVTSACRSKRLGVPLALAYVRREQFAPGTPLDSSAGRAVVLDGAVTPRDAV